MAFELEVENALKQKLDKKVIRQREESGIRLDYLEGWYVIDKMNEIFGFGNWSYDVTELCEISKSVNERGNITIGYRARVRVVVLGRAVIQREDVGFGNGISKQEHKAHENAGKEAVTDALKRACRTFGDVFGNTLYDKERKGVCDYDAEREAERKKELANAKSEITKIIKELAPNENLKNIATYIKNNGLDISNNPQAVLEDIETLKSVIGEYLNNKPQGGAFESSKESE